MTITVEKDRITVTVPGHSWHTGAQPPDIEGWYPFFVAHFGTDRTEWTYKPV